MKLRILLIGLLACCFFGSCTIKQRYDFNEDLSGTYSTSIDMSQLAAIAGDSAMNELDKDLNADSVTQALNGLEGLSNTRLTLNDNALTISIAFDKPEDVNQMNKAANSEKEKISSNRFFERKGSKIYYDQNDLSGALKDKAEEGMETMGALIEMEMIFSFAKAPRKIKGADYEISKDKKTAVLRTNLKDFLDGKDDYAIWFKP